MRAPTLFGLGCIIANLWGRTFAELREVRAVQNAKFGDFVEATTGREVTGMFGRG